MRFGRSYHEHLIPEWAPFYVNYNGYKRLIKTATSHIDTLETNLVLSLRKELDRVNGFYIDNHAIVQQRIRRCYHELGYDSLESLCNSESCRSRQSEVNYLRHHTVQILQALRKIIWFGKVNGDAFKRLYRRLDNSVLNNKRRLSNDVFSFQCVSQDESLNDLRQISNLVAGLDHDSFENVEARNFRPLYQDLDTNCYNQKEGSDQRDGCSPLHLHYAAEHGLADLCREYFGRFDEQRANGTSKAELSDSIIMNGLDGRSPLQLSVIGGHTEVTKLLLGALDMEQTEQLNEKLDPLLLIAVRSKFIGITRLLIEHCANMNYQDAFGETALYVAVRSDQSDCVEFLLQSAASPHVNINLRENSRGWTPLIIGCVENRLSMVNLLLEHGADQNIRDLSGWTAKEHAAFRGNLKILQTLLLDQKPSRDDLQFDISSGKSVNPVLPPAKKKYLAHYVESKSFQEEKEDSRIFVTLGSSNLRKPVKAVDLSPAILFHTTNIPPEIGFALRISAIDAVGSSRMIHLPVLENAINEPWLFTCKEPDNVKLVFHLYRINSYSTNNEVLIGSGIALLKCLKQGLAQNRESLIRDFTISLLGKENLAFLGSVTFNFLTVKPFYRPQKVVSPVAHGFWRNGGPIQIVGHRGSGANSVAKSNLQIGENTVLSFITAASLGASCVEFDVQLTRDLSTAIFHDFLVMETGGDIPLQSLTAEQFMLLGTAQAPRGYPSGMAETRFHERNGSGLGIQKKPRSLSLNQYDEYRSDDLVSRMKHTIEGRRGIKGNVRGSAIQEPFTTLEELLVKLPESVAFDLEMKYPMLWEAEDRSMEPYATETNIFVDVVLQKVYNLAGNRNITFSSFSPELCILLAYKQQDYPVMFISKAGAQVAGDIRAANLQQAIQFAKSWNLAGTVMFAAPLIFCPRLVQYARDPGLVCATYGDLNDDPEYAKILAEAGLDAIIVNKVRLIAQTLAGSKV